MATFAEIRGYRDVRAVEEFIFLGRSQAYIYGAEKVRSPRQRYRFQSEQVYADLNERRRQFFEELIEKKLCLPSHMALGVGVPGSSVDDTIDLVVYEDDECRSVRCVIDFVRAHDSRTPVEVLRDIVRKARAIQSPYSGYITPAERLYVDVELWSDTAPEQALLSGVL